MVEKLRDDNKIRLELRKCIIIETTCEVQPKTPVSAGVFWWIFKTLMV